MIKHKGKNSKDTESIIRALLEHTNEKGMTASQRNDIYLYELQCSFDKVIRPGFAISVLQEMKKSNDSNIQTFIKLYNQEEYKYKKKKGSLVQEWKIFIPFNIKTSKRKLHLERTEVQFLTAKSLKKEFRKNYFSNTCHIAGDEVINKLSSSQVFQLISEYCISIKCSGSDIYDAWNTAEQHYDLIRGIFEFVVSPSTQLLSPFRKRAKIENPKIIIGLNDKDEGHFFKPISDTNHSCNDFELNKEQNRVLINILNIFSKKGLKTKSFSSLLADIFRLYSQAMDSIYSYDCLMNLWQMCERMTCADNLNGSTKEVVRRLSWHSERLSLAGSGWSESLKMLADKRNDIVHRGFTFVEDREIDLLRTVTNSTLRWLLSLSKELNTERQLEEYYQMRTLSSSELALKKSVITLIEKERKNNQ